MRVLLKLAPNKMDVPIKYWRHALAEIGTNFIPRQEHEFYDKMDYIVGPTALFTFNYPSESELLLFSQLENLADECEGTIRITIAIIGSEYTTAGKNTLPRT